LETATTKYLELSGVEISGITAVTRTLFETEAAKEIAALAESGVEAKGDAAKESLAIMIKSGDSLAAEVAETAVRNFSTVHEMEPITIILSGSYLLALAVVSKISYDSKSGWSLKSGFPGLTDVLDKAAKLVSAAIRPGSKGVAGC
jgi:hypothetical protein